MGLSGPEVVISNIPVVLGTLFRHYFNKKGTLKDSQAREELLFDEAFTVMKSFLEISTKNTVEDLQQFSNAHMPSPPTVLVLPLLIPLSVCHDAAKHLIDALGGPEAARSIVGGTEWWQVRGERGVRGEWIAMRRDWREREKKEESHRKKWKAEREKEKDKDKEERPLTEEELGKEYEKEKMDEMRCMLYIHGGAYYWGSINTHRYTIWRYARKMKGRAFAVNYRKAPQYPFPCALQDCLAAYLYLLKPPPGAKHAPIPPSQIVFAGDSAGGGLVLALLQVIRDTGLPMPSGAVAISPWCDLTHCFPSVMENFATDVMPPYGFIHKPSTLWPPPAPELSAKVHGTIREKVREAADRVRASTSSLHGGKPVATPKGSNDQTHKSMEEETEGKDKEEENTTRGDTIIDEKRQGSLSDPPPGAATLAHSPPVSSNGESDDENDEENDEGGTGYSRKTTSQGDTLLERPSVSADGKTTKASASEQLHPLTEGTGSVEDAHKRPPATEDEARQARQRHQNIADPQDAKRNGKLVLDVDGKRVTIRGQIQLYTTNDLLSHPYVSPALGYLGGLCPLLVIASDKELLRDEIVYVAHKAAHPERYPVRGHVKAMLPNLKGIEDRFGPTKVHLQIYDEVCHVLPLYSMTTPAKYCFRSIANFCKFVTGPHISDAEIPGTPVSGSRVRPDVGPESLFVDSATPSRSASPGLTPVTSTTGDVGSSSSTGPSRRASFDAIATAATPAVRGSEKLEPFTLPERSGTTAGSASIATTAKPDSSSAGDGPDTAGHPAVYAIGEGDPFNVPNAGRTGMIRERVSTRGVIRPLEPEEDIKGLHMPEEEIGMIKELPAKRYLTGQGLWDKKYKRAAKTVEHHRKRNLEKSRKDGMKLIQAWTEKAEKGILKEDIECGEEEKFVIESPRWSWNWALKNEHPPPSAVVSRRDTGEARKLARIADHADDSHTKLGGANLWSHAMNLLTPSTTSAPERREAPTKSASTPDPVTPAAGPSTVPKSKIKGTAVDSVKRSEGAEKPERSHSAPVGHSAPSTSSSFSSRITPSFLRFSGRSSSHMTSAVTSDGEEEQLPHPTPLASVANPVVPGPRFVAEPEGTIVEPSVPSGGLKLGKVVNQ